MCKEILHRALTENAQTEQLQNVTQNREFYRQRIRELRSATLQMQRKRAK
jgi:hypothetical protein